MTNKMDIEKIRKQLEELDDEPILDDFGIDEYKKLKQQSTNNPIALGKVFILSYNLLESNSYLLEDPKILEDYLNSFNSFIEELRELVESYGVGEGVGSYVDSLKIKKIVRDNRRQIIELNNLFFSILSDD